MNNGRKHEVLFEPYYYVPGGMFGGGEPQIEPNVVKLWADDGLLELIENVPGVATATTYNSQFQYVISFDHRYDIEEVKKAIETAILCRPLSSADDTSRVQSVLENQKELQWLLDIL